MIETNVSQSLPSFSKHKSFGGLCIYKPAVVFIWATLGHPQKRLFPVQRVVEIMASGAVTKAFFLLFL